MTITNIQVNLYLYLSVSLIIPFTFPLFKFILENEKWKNKMDFKGIIILIIKIILQISNNLLIRRASKIDLKFSSIVSAYCHSRNSLSSLCSYITGDALLYSMFREEAIPVPCPFRGPMTFSYNRGHGTCSVPVSNVDTCTDDSRLLFRYQACPDISASESAGKLSVIIEYCISLL